MALKDLASTTLAGSLLVQKHSPDYHGFYNECTWL